MLNYLKCMLQLLLSPGNGWEDISHEGRDERTVAMRGFFPFAALVALSCVAELWYDPEVTYTGVAIRAVLTMVKYFTAYYVAWFVMPIKLTDYIEGEYNEKRTTTFILYSLGLMGLIEMLQNLLPMEVGLLTFAVVYVAIIMWKGARYMAVAKGKTPKFMILAICAIIVPVYLLGWIFDMLF